MLAPALRLVVIYLAVGLAVFAFFKRDRIATLFSGDEPAAAAATAATAPAQHAVAPVQPVTAEPPATPAAAAQPPAPQAAPTGLQTPTAPAATAPAETPTLSADITARRNEARRAYWNGETSKAIAIYSELLTQKPDDMGLNGELANIFYMTGDSEKAARHYSAAARAALMAGNRPQLQMLVSILRPLDRAEADRLQTSLEAMR